MFHLIASDIDGTLANGVGEIPPFTVQVLQRLLDQGMPVVLVTGLNPWPTRRHVEQIGHGVCALCLNGVFRLEAGQLTEGLKLECGVIRQAVALMLEEGSSPLVYGQDGVSRYLPGSNGEGRLAELAASRPYQPYEVVDSLEALLAVSPVQVSTIEEGPRARRLYDRLSHMLERRAYVVHQPSPRWGAWVEVNHPRARKDTALLALAAELGVGPDEILYFGDSLNDLPVFQAVPHAVAVANARPELWTLAWRMAACNEEEGVAHFLAQRFDLN